MKKTKLSIIVICMILMISIFSSSLSRKHSDGRDYRYMKTYDYELINTVLDTITVSKGKALDMGWSAEYIESKAGDSITVAYPKITEEQIDTSNNQDVRMFRIHDYEGNILMEREYNDTKERYALSNNKKYIIFSERPDDYDMDLHTEFYDDNGKLLWEKDSFRYFTTILNNGISIGGYGAYFNKYGEEIGIRPIIKPYPEFITVDVIDNNNVFYSFRWHGNKSLIMVTDSMGNEKWRKELPYKFARPDQYDIDSDLGIVGIYEKYLGRKDIYHEKYQRTMNIEDWEYGVCYVNIDGNVIYKKKLDLKGDKYVKISKNKEKVYVYSTNNRLFALDIYNGEELWNWNDEIEDAWSKFGINNVIEAGNEIILDIRSIGKWKDTKIIVLDSETREIKDKTIYKNNKISITNIKDLIFLIDKREGMIKSYREKQ